MRCAVMLMLPLLLTATMAWANERAAEQDSDTLRVCADPNNLPFSNQAGQGFENHLAELLAKSMNKRVEYTWWAQRRGFLRETLNAGQCDVVMGLPTGIDQALTTQPYYRSSFVLVYRADRNYHIRSLDDPRLRQLRIGVHLIGRENPPPAVALARRGLTRNVVGYSIYGDYREANPPLQMMQAVAHGDIDIAILWGPLAGYFARQQPVALTIVPLVSSKPGEQPFRFSISLGVRRGDQAMQQRLNSVLVSEHAQIQALLDDYNVPRVPATR